MEKGGHLLPELLERCEDLTRLQFWGLGSRVRVEGMRVRVEGLAFRVCGLGFRVQGLGFRV